MDKRSVVPSEDNTAGACGSIAVAVVSVNPEAGASEHFIFRVRDEPERRTRETLMVSFDDTIETARQRPSGTEMVRRRIINETRSASVASGDRPKACAASVQETS